MTASRSATTAKGSHWICAVVLLGLSLALTYKPEGVSLLSLLAMLLLLWQRELRHDWLRDFGLPCAAVSLYMAFNAALALHPAAAMPAVADMILALLITVPAVYILRLDSCQLQRALALAVPTMLTVSLVLFVYEYEQVGWEPLANLTGLYASSNRNTIATLFACGLICSVVGGFLAWGRWRPVTLFVAAAVLFLLMGYINNSRGALMGTLAAIPVVFIRAYPRRAMAAVAVLLLVLCVGYFSSYGKSVMQHNGSLDNGRSEIWAAFIDKTEQRPLVGYGAGAFYVDQGMRSQHPEIAPLYYPHSIYVDLFYSSGIVGLLFWAGWFSWLALVCGHRLQAGNTAVIGLGGAMLVYMLVHGLVDHAFYNYGILGILVFGTTLFCARLPVTDVTIADNADIAVGSHE